MKQVIYFLIALMLIVFVTNTLAQFPRFITYQGMLMGSNGQPVPDGQYQLTFKIYDDVNNLLWTEVHNQVFIGGGMLNAILGMATPLSLAFEKPYFLGIQVGSDPELQPRMPLTSVAYALRAADANRLMGISVSTTAEANKLLPLDASGKFPASVISGGAVSGDYLGKNVPDTSRGTSNSPMLLVSNLGDGDGINGRAKSGIGLSGRSDSNNGIDGWTGASDKSGVFGSSTEGRGVVGRSEKSDGVVGWTDAADNSGVFGHSTYGLGVTGQSEKKNGVYGTTTVNSNDYAGVSRL